ncbi:hypothetical protein Q2T76_06845 [Lactobacillus sp. YT155]|uniref:hypothetical protein n=1 Tax=Lactobacillus sp. YT155 TaxID=3060955 RepID=UPI00265DB0E3|nr:hypothetical protein [Lactobacillus sp. YT155]MDO1605774.1 hypothetical protein [Lactobacillus sp. YT155]
MAEFSYLRPLITEHFIFDFPAHFSIKQISDFTQGNYDEVTEKSNLLMQEIMSGEICHWYIEEKNSNQIIGAVSYNFANTQLVVKLDESLDQRFLSEIAQRIAQICYTNLKLTTFSINPDANVLICHELETYYNMVNKKFTLK